MNYVIKNDNPDFGFSVDVGEVRDSDGELLPDESVTLTIESSNPNILAVSTNADGKSGNIHVGTSGVAAFTVQAKAPNGDILASGGDNFTVTTGDPASVSSVATTFDGLTPVPEPIPEPVP